MVMTNTQQTVTSSSGDNSSILILVMQHMGHGVLCPQREFCLKGGG